MIKVLHRMGVFGGTFNPVHIGHLRLAEDVREEYELEKVIFIPTNIPPHKPFPYGESALHRIEMLKRALEGNDDFLLDKAEIERGGISYTVDTVKYLYKNYSFKGKPYFLIGSDLAVNLHTWRSVKRLVQSVHFVVLMRQDMDIESILPVWDRIDVRDNNVDVSYFSKRTIDITSSEIRERVRTGRSIRYLVPEKVYSYIQEHGLYKNRKFS